MSRPVLRTAILCIFSLSVSAFSLRDAAIESGLPPTYLDGAWSASEASLGINISATVPGDVISDLQRSGLIGDPWYELNFLDNRTLWDVSSRSWRYSTSIQLPAQAANESLLLVFEGVKMGAHVAFNDIEIGVVSNQFMRYTFPLSGTLVKPGAPNFVSLTFDSSIPLDARFMPCTGGWDWAPFSQLYLNDSTWGKAATFSSGIWKSAYLLQVTPGSVAITDVVPLVHYLGEYPVGALTDGTHAGFLVNLTAHVWVPDGGAAGSFTVAGGWGSSSSSVSSLRVSLPPGQSNISFSLRAAASDILLWWPNGLGAHPLYNVSITWNPVSNSSVPVTAVRRIGFRTAALVTVNDTNATVVNESTGADGSGNFGMFFRINGAAIYARGANLVPSEGLEGRLDATAFHTLVRSAADANMNMIRVWGGGIYPPDVFYDTCDEEGILLYHDLMFAGSGHDISSAHQPFSAATNDTILGELMHQVRRLSPHPSLVLYDSANEVIVQRSGPTSLYASFVLPAVAAEDPSRILWPASPAAGWASGVDRLWGTPNGKPLLPIGSGHIWDAGSERHGPYMAGVGSGNWTTVVRDPWSQDHTFNPGTPLSYLPSPGVPSGPGAPSVFASEFGTLSFSSFEAMSAALDESSWGLHGGGKVSNCTPESGNVFVQNCTGRNAMAQRNWACDNLIWSYFGPALLNASGEAAFKGQIFQCLIASAIHTQLDIEARRAENNLGTLLWQLQETWVTGGWGSIEYGSPSVPGILRGGRWKPTHNWLQTHLFQDAMSACGLVGRSKTFVCYVTNARSDSSFVGNLSISAIDLSTGGSSLWGTWPVNVSPGPGSLAWVSPGMALPNSSTTVLLASLTDGAGVTSDEHMVHVTPPVSLIIPQAHVSAVVAAQPNDDGSVNVTVTSDAVALFVTLTSSAPGRFSDNAFVVTAQSPRAIAWLPFEPGNATADTALLASSLRVEDMSAYMSTSSLEGMLGTQSRGLVAGQQR